MFGALPLNVGDEADDRRLVESTRALFKTGFFQDIQLSREGDVLVINVVERPSVASVEFEGNKAISTEDLMKGMKQSGLAEGEIFQRATLEGVRNELQRQYVAQGRYSASVETQVVAIKQGEKYDRTKVQERHRDHALFVGFAPADDPKIVVAVMVENGESGSGVAAPVVRQIMDAWLLADDGRLKSEYGGPPSSTEVTASEE